MNALRGEAEVGHHGDFGCGEGADQFNARAFDLDGFGAGFLHERTALARPSEMEL